MSVEQRRFPPPWTAEETDACFIVKDHNGMAVAYVYFEDEPGRRTAAQPAQTGRGQAHCCEYHELAKRPQY